MSVLPRASLLKPLIAAVKYLTESVAANPDRRVKTMASFKRFKVSAAVKPCRENSVAASLTSLNACPVFLATSKRSLPNFCRLLLVNLKILFNSVRFLFSSILSFTKALNALPTELITPTAAPNAKTRAADASRDFWNSLI